MIYLDLECRPIIKSEWERLLRTRGYGQIALTKLGATIVETSWIGCAEDHEKPPMIFLTQVKIENAKTKKRSQVVEQWSATAKDALRVHQTIVQKIKAMTTP